MRWEARQGTSPIEWHKWFAWRPVRCTLLTSEADMFEPTHWVWLEPVNRKLTEGWCSDGYVYAIYTG